MHAFKLPISVDKWVPEHGVGFCRLGLSRNSTADAPNRELHLQYVAHTQLLSLVEQTNYKTLPTDSSRKTPYLISCLFLVLSVAFHFHFFALPTIDFALLGGGWPLICSFDCSPFKVTPPPTRLKTQVPFDIGISLLSNVARLRLCYSMDVHTLKVVM